MISDNNPNPVNEPKTDPTHLRETPAKPGLPDQEGDKKIKDVADRLAHKGAKREQDFDKDNTKLFSN